MYIFMKRRFQTVPSHGCWDAYASPYVKNPNAGHTCSDMSMTIKI